MACFPFMTSVPRLLFIQTFSFYPAEWFFYSAFHSCFISKILCGLRQVITPPPPAPSVFSVKGNSLVRNFLRPMLTLSFSSESFSYEKFQVLIGIYVGIIPDVPRNQTSLPLSLTAKLQWLSHLPLHL